MSSYWAEYSSFTISSESTGYMLTVGGYSGNAGDAFKTSNTADWISNGMKFTASDVDNDKNSGGNCALTYGGGAWWFKWCSASLLNNDPTACWTTVGATGDVRKSRMMIRLV
jgi:Fibrinogen beta and gamma chains, C-terminal globular domain